MCAAGVVAARDITSTPADGGGMASAMRLCLPRRGATIWLTGLSGSGKTTIAVATEAALRARGLACHRLDGDQLRHGLCGDLGFSPADRDENIRRAGEVSRLFAEAGLISLASFISPYAAGRLRARRLHEDAGLVFLLAHVDCPLAVAEARDPKGLYRRARAGEIADFTGIDAPYEAPEAPDVVLRSDRMSVAEEVAALLAALARRGVVDP